jgi:CRP/FNR family transcriptional regulator
MSNSSPAAMRACAERKSAMPDDEVSISDLPQGCRDCDVRHSGICAALTTLELCNFAKSARHTQHRPGESLAYEDGEVTSYANVTGGIVKLSRLLSDGREQVVGLQFAPDLMGRLFAETNPLTVQAASDVGLCRVPKSVLEAMIGSSAALKQRLLDQSLRDLDDAREWMVTLGRKDARQRVASLLLLIAKRCGVSDGTEPDTVSFELPLTRSDMADFLGITLETVSRQITKLRHDDIVRVVNHRQVTIPDMARLVACAG